MKIKIIFTILFLILIFFIKIFFLDPFAQSKNFKSFFDLTKTIIINYIHSDASKIPVMKINIDDYYFNKIKTQRNDALKRGLIIPSDKNWVPAEIIYKNKKYEVKLRLKGHMTDHIQGKKWSYRIKIKKGKYLEGMKRFSIQAPGTRGYIYEWIFYELMKREDIVHLKYFFVKVIQNGEDKGIYAVEENFDDGFTFNNKRPKGPIFRFNPDLYWIDRYNEIIKDKVNNENAKFSSSYIEAYRTNKLINDSTQLKYFIEAQSMMEAFRRQKLRTSQIFDIDKMAKMHAIIDLVGGYHSLDWSDIKFYYNPVIQKIEPVAYESFTSNRINNIAGSYKFKKKPSTNDYYELLFSDSTFFKLYIKYLEKITKKKYLDSIFNDINKSLKKNLKILNSEFPYKKFDVKNPIYYKNAKSIRRLLDMPQSVHTFLQEKDSNKIVLSLSNVSAFPIKVKKLILSDSISIPLNILLYPKNKNKIPEFIYKKINVKKQYTLNYKKLKIEYSILGSSYVKFSNVFPYPFSDEKYTQNILLLRKGNIQKFDFIFKNDSNKTILILPGKHNINRPLIIDKGYTLRCTANTQINFKDSGMIISYSPLKFIGYEDKFIKISSSKKNNGGILILNTDTDKISIFKNVIFNNTGFLNYKNYYSKAFLTCYNSNIKLIETFFNNSKKIFINLIKSNFYFYKSYFNNCNNYAISLIFSKGNINYCTFNKINDDAVYIENTILKIKQCTFDSIYSNALYVKHLSNIELLNINFNNCNTAIKVTDESNIKGKNIIIKNSKKGIDSKNTTNITIDNIKEN